MFKTLKLYTGQIINPDEIIPEFIRFGYRRQEQVLEEGEFSYKGEVLDIYPVTFECPIRIVLDFNKISSIHTIDLSSNKIIWVHQLVIILPINKAYHRQISAFNEDLPLNLFVELQKGDYVVHVKHGIGRYLAKESLPTAQGQKDFYVLEYANKEKLFVPVTDAHLIQKFISFKGKHPKLNRLGTKEWKAVKKRVKKGIRTIALGLLEAQAKRLIKEGFAFSKDTPWQAQFEKGFIFKETPGQIKASQDVKKDLESKHPMDRLLCGDVGYGKTEVAMRASFKAVMDNKQVAILVPTTLLAEQHYQNFSKRLQDFPVNVKMLSRFISSAQENKIIEGLKNHTVDIVIGTHRLLSQDIIFKDLGLLVIDDEQRFGVKAKEKIKSFKLSVDILTLSATPIPRTLYMGLMGAKDISVINTPPQNRLAVATYVVEYDKEIIKQAITKELNRGGQVFYIHNRIEDIESVYERIRVMVPEKTNIAYAHGRMTEHTLEEIMLGFFNHKIDCLVSTTIIESGIDVPSCNTIIVDDAHTFGLCDLHQLRGRVGRFNRKAYAYFLIPDSEILLPLQRKRLETIKEYSELGSGFRIAMEDLEIRGAGNLLGFQQHGFIQSVGFDLYCRLIKETITLLKEGKTDS